MAQLYQWNAGDIYEYSDCSNLFDHYGTLCNPVEHYIIDSVASVSTGTGGVSYTCGGAAYYYAAPLPVSPLVFPSGPFYYSVATNSEVLSYDTTLIIDTMLMPEEFKNPSLYGYQPNDTSYCVNGTLYSLLGSHGGYISDAQYIRPIEAGGSDPTTYKAPLGLLSKKAGFMDVDGFSINSQNLIYYKRGSATCGSHVVPEIVGVSKVEAIGNLITLAPNPAEDELTISSGAPINSVSVMNSLGQVICSQQYNANKVVVNVSNMPAGVYLVRINGSEVRRFVKN